MENTPFNRLYFLHFSNDSEAYSAVYAGSGQIQQAGKTHQRVKSFSHFLPGWFNNTKEVQVEVVVEQNKDDYYDVNFDKKTESPESMSFFSSNNMYLFRGSLISEGIFKLVLASKKKDKRNQYPQLFIC